MPAAPQLQSRPAAPAPRDAAGGVGVPVWQQESGAAGHAARRTRVRIVAFYLLTVYLLTTLIFILPRTLPGDPLRGYMDEYTEVRPEVRVELERMYGLDGSLFSQYTRYLARLGHGDLGRSIASSQPVSQLMRKNLPWTLLLTGSALVLSSVISLRMGLDAAWRRGTRKDRALQILCTVLRSVPEYAVGMFLLIGFSVVLKVFPVAGASTPFSTSTSQLAKVIDVVWHLMLPLTALTLGLIGTKFLMVRNITIGVLGQDYMLLARAKGLPQALQRRHHAGRNVMLPFLHLVGAQVGVAIAGGIFVQQVFGYPGIGNVMTAAVTKRDYPVVEACFLLLSFLVLTANLVIDLLSTAVDPRARTE